MIAKPSSLDRKVSKWQKQTVREKEKQARKNQAERKWRALSAFVKHRDEGRCRVCNFPTTLTGDPRNIGQAHHLIYRSAGGKDIPSNLVWLCGWCHDAEHRHVLTMSGTAEALLWHGIPSRMRP